MSSSLRGEAILARPDPSSEPASTIYLGRLQHDGNWNPEPAAMQYLGATLSRDFNIRLETGPVKVSDLDVEDWPIVYMTGTRSFSMEEIDRNSLKKYLEGGGIVIADAAGGSADFVKAINSLASSLTGRILPLPRASAIYSQPYNMKRVEFRRAAARSLPEAQANIPRLRAGYIRNRPAIIISNVDICAGLVGYPLFGLKGYSPADARKLMINTILNVSGIRVEPKP
jgi:hypothetical protein